MRTRYADVTPYVTKDGSQIRELMHPAVHGNREQSFAEAIVAPGAETRLHRHRTTEEIYYIAQGAGLMRLADESFEVREGDTIAIAPGTPHCVRNTGAVELKIFCACAPPYAHEDTELL